MSGKGKEWNLNQKRVNDKTDLIDFGNQCHGCPSGRFHDAKIKVYRCLKCFKFECVVCKNDCRCKTVCQCKHMQRVIETKLKEATFLFRSIDTTANSISVNLKYNNFKFHDGVCLFLEIKMEKRFGEEQITVPCSVRAEQTARSYMKIYIEHEHPHPHPETKISNMQSAFINLESMMEQKVVAVYCGADKLQRHDTCVGLLNNVLEQRDIQLSITNDFTEAFDKNDGPLVVISLIHSRPISDVGFTLNGIKETFYKRIILVLLHFKAKDDAKCAEDIMKQFPGVNAVDYFQHRESAHIEDVANVIFRAINSFYKSPIKQ